MSGIVDGQKRANWSSQPASAKIAAGNDEETNSRFIMPNCIRRAEVRPQTRAKVCAWSELPVSSPRRARHHFEGPVCNSHFGAPRPKQNGARRAQRAQAGRFVSGRIGTKLRARTSRLGATSTSTSASQPASQTDSQAAGPQTGAGSSCWAPAARSGALPVGGCHEQTAGPKLRRLSCNYWATLGNCWRTYARVASGPPWPIWRAS